MALTNKERCAAYYIANKVKLRLQGAVWHAAHKETENARNRAWRKNNQLKANSVSALWHEKHPERQEGYSKTNYTRHKPHFVAKCAKRRAAKLRATPPWLTKEQLRRIEDFYAEAARLQAADGIKRHVDHIYPLQGKTVCGLHVPWNLQILTSAANLRKSNKLHDPRL